MLAAQVRFLFVTTFTKKAIKPLSAKVVSIRFDDQEYIEDIVKDYVVYSQDKIDIVNCRN